VSAWTCHGHCPTDAIDQTGQSSENTPAWSALPFLEVGKEQTEAMLLQNLCRGDRCAQAPRPDFTAPPSPGVKLELDGPWSIVHNFEHQKFECQRVEHARAIA
jgi:hypothetical protein